MTAPFEILHEDEYMIAINKPSGILVHRTGISEDKVFVLQELRNQINQRIYPIHRLDRGTSGVLVFGKSQDAASRLGIKLQEHFMTKSYLAIVRGYVLDSDTIDYPLLTDSGQSQDAITHYQLLQKNEVNLSIGMRYPTARFSLVNITPKTGRTHQIRKHFSHIRHPVINDKKHGDVKHNTYFRDVLGIYRMLLHANQLSFEHPYTFAPMVLSADLDTDFQQALKKVMNN
jgi:tRNA pseudouridine65 synthase